MQIFQHNPYPRREELLQLAKLFNTSSRRVESWFSTKRRGESRDGKLPESEYTAPACFITLHNLYMHVFMNTNKCIHKCTHTAFSHTPP